MQVSAKGMAGAVQLATLREDFLAALRCGFGPPNPGCMGANRCQNLPRAFPKHSFAAISCTLLAAHARAAQHGRHIHPRL